MYFKRNIQDGKNRINGCRPVLNLAGAALFFVCQYQNDVLLFQYHDVIGYLLNLFALTKHESCWALVVLVFFLQKNVYNIIIIIISICLVSSNSNSSSSISSSTEVIQLLFFCWYISDQINTIKYINALRARLSSSALIEKNSKNPLGHHNWFTRTVFLFICSFFHSFSFSHSIHCHCCSCCCCSSDFCSWRNAFEWWWRSVN